MLNSIGLDNDGIETFIAYHLPYWRALRHGDRRQHRRRTHDEFVAMAGDSMARTGIAAIELNISCPNVSGGVDFGTDPDMCERSGRRRPRGLPAADHGQADAERRRHRRRSPARPSKAEPMQSR